MRGYLLDVAYHEFRTKALRPDAPKALKEVAETSIVKIVQSARGAFNVIYEPFNGLTLMSLPQNTDASAKNEAIQYTSHRMQRPVSVVKEKE